MHDTNQSPQPPLPTQRQLAKATAVAVLAAGALLVTTVLPAEYGIDPTGIGRLLGLTDMGKSKQQPAPTKGSLANGRLVAFNVHAPGGQVLSDASVAGSSILLAEARAERSDEVSVTLRPNESAEVKAFMKTGDSLKYSWSTDSGRLNFEFHGEPPNAPSNVFTSYQKGTRDKAEGTFTAKFDGTHGWFWRNRTSQPITVTVKTTGRYEKLDRVK
jgi:hypothetical protein